MRGSEKSIQKAVVHGYSANQPLAVGAGPQGQSANFPRRQPSQAKGTGKGQPLATEPGDDEQGLEFARARSAAWEFTSWTKFRHHAKYSLQHPERPL